MTVPSSMPWVKAHTDDLLDVRLMKRSSENAQRVYLLLERLAGLCDADGSFVLNGVQLTDEEIADKISTDPRKLRAAIKELTKNQLITANGHGPCISNFVDRQVSQAARREKWREQQKQHRATDTGSSQQSVSTDSGLTPAPRARVQSPESESSKSKSQPTTLPSSKRKDLAGGQAGKSKSAGPRAEIKLNKAQRARKETIIKILTSFGIRNPKLETLSVILATRSYKSDEQMTTRLLAGISSALSDERAHNKEAIAAHRLECDQVSPRFEDPQEWRVIPQKVLDAAGIDDLHHYITRRRYGNYPGGDE